MQKGQLWHCWLVPHINLFEQSGSKLDRSKQIPRTHHLGDHLVADGIEPGGAGVEVGQLELVVEEVCVGRHIVQHPGGQRQVEAVDDTCGGARRAMKLVQASQLMFIPTAVRCMTAGA